MANRAQRRAILRNQEKKNKQLLANSTREQVMFRLMQNGITMDDLKKEYWRGREDGFHDAGENLLKCCYAGIILALSEEFGFDEDQCYRALCAADKRIVAAIEHTELSNEVLEKVGLRLDLDEPLERVQKIQRGNVNEGNA